MSEKQLNSALKHLLRDEYSQAEDLLKKIVSSITIFTGWLQYIAEPCDVVT